jgi:aminoglycoside 6-adenylyltransferase
MTELTRDQWFQRTLAWAETRPDIRALALAGSSARADHPADAWSDLDWVVVADEPRRYLLEHGWIAELGPSWADFVERGPTGEPLERRVLFAGGQDMDFIVAATRSARQNFNDQPVLREILSGGLRVLSDRENLLVDFQSAVPRRIPTGSPPVEEFLAVVNDFWFHCAWTAKKLRRGELWVAKSCCDRYLKDLLLRMVEWEAQSQSGWKTEPWYGGRFLEQRACPQTLVELRDAFAAYDAADIGRALQTSMALFSRIARALALAWETRYPLAEEEQVRDWVTGICVEC